MGTPSKKIEYRSQAEKDYLTAVHQFRQMFKNVTPQLSKEVNQLELLAAKAEMIVASTSIKSKPERKNDRVKARTIARKQKDEDLKKQTEHKAILKQKEKREASKIKERIRIQNEPEDKRVLPNRIINHRELVAVKIDAKTTIYIKPGADPIQARKNFIEKHSMSKADPDEMPVPGKKATDFQVWMDRVKERALKQNVAISKFHVDFFQAKFREGMKPFDCLKMYVDQIEL